MFVDKQLLLSDGQDLSQTADTYYSSNAINLSSVVGDIGNGAPTWMVFVVDEAFASSGAATVVFAIIDEEDATLDGSSVVILQTAAIAYTTLTEGKTICIPLPAGLITQQYIGASYTIAGATTTAGTVSAFLSPQPVLNP